MENVNKKELARRVALHAGLNDVEANTIVGVVVDEIRKAVIEGEQVSLANFGVFEGRYRAARTGRNPRTGEAKEVPARTAPVFRVAKNFREAVAAAAETRAAA